MPANLPGTLQHRVARCLFAVLAMASLPFAAWAAEASTAVESRQQTLIGVLQSNAPPAEKAIACKQLAICGDKAAVPALAALLPDGQLSSWALIALEAIPDSAVDEALREAAKTLKGRELIGAINSIGVRRDPAAIPVLRQRLTDQDPQVFSASAASLGKIGGAEATKILEPLLASASETGRSAAAQALVLCAEQLLKAGHAEEAVALYDRIRTADVPVQRKLEAVRGAILARGREGLPLLIEQLQSSDREMFRLGLSVAREVGGKEVAAAVSEELGKVRQASRSGEAGDDQGAREVPLIDALAEVGGADALPVILEIAKSGSAAGRLAAIDVLGQIGDGRAVPVLLQAAQAPGDLGKTALESLNKVEGVGVDQAVAGGLASAEGPIRVILIRLAGYRRIASAVPELLKAADSGDPEVRLAALGALGRTVDFARLGNAVKDFRQPVLWASSAAISSLAR